ncbi:Uncharacterized conserved protein, DUF305 family [Sinosporangium album]|uniref:Uncharacterized conserved protein, DUF305 family n=1 Tax=Sinosporangium album TaxID=504805 RepID=A0A1G7UZY3_9ACTN|nr:DUF305 domain-containing protein [Sinosporangium album]SDG53034.1 Uncharacterized conserved protein, DUF305 family [Sinosporangium album]
MSTFFTTFTTTKFRALAVAAAAAAVLAGCSSGEATQADGGEHAGGHGTAASSSAPATAGSTQPGAAFNDADVTFAQMMIPHHQQAIEMSDLAATRASNPEIKKLAEEIKAAQGPEIAKLTSWLTTWGKEPMPAGHTMDGMLTADEMADLEKAKGKAFDKLFAELMIRHHEGAITMAQTEVAQGAFPEAKTMAETIVATQQTEIDTMRELLKKL